MNTRFSKVLVFGLLIVVLALPAMALVPSAAAQTTIPLAVFDQPDAVYTVSPEDTILLYNEWWVCRAPGLFTSYKNAFAVELTIDGVTVLDGSVRATKPYWWPTYEFASDLCNNHPDETYGSLWVYDLSNLDAGNHTIEWTAWQTHQVTDLYDADENGKPDKYPAEEFHASTTIIVD